LQRGPIWWAAVHRHHHRHSDTDADWHTPKQGFWHAHIGWLESPRILDVSYARVRDLTRYPELRFIDTFYHLPALVLIAVLVLLGTYLEQYHPGLGTSGAQLVVWGFLLRTVFSTHAIFAVNSVLHSWGSRRFETDDNSRNSHILGWISLGDGFHNNHHRYAASARHGFYWWEIDITYCAIRLLEALGLVWHVRRPPRRVLEEGLHRQPSSSPQPS
jgi:stearoyl-CoA desaturase (delta-9 desaturase)